MRWKVECKKLLLVVLFAVFDVYIFYGVYAPCESGAVEFLNPRRSIFCESKKNRTAARHVFARVGLGTCRYRRSLYLETYQIATDYRARWKINYLVTHLICSHLREPFSSELPSLKNMRDGGKRKETLRKANWLGLDQIIAEKMFSSSAVEI